MWIRKAGSNRISLIQNKNIIYYRYKRGTIRAMNSERLKSTRKLAIEFVVIVAGVFVALAAESWWSEREHRQLEREIHEDMIVEFEANLRILNADITINKQVHGTLEMFVKLSDEALFMITDIKLSEQFNPYLIWAGFDPEMGSAQAFVESGKIGVIEDRKLRILMSRWAGLLEMNRRFNLQAVDFQHRVVAPQIAQTSADESWSTSERREIRNLIGHLFVLHKTVLNNQYVLQIATQDILAFLREER